ncbi:MAG: lactonase family protein [Cyclobacteriaceae bacterium]|nr:lactonase family protein [Cyclobacteriaceae bacterium HetDA_MAG_MS6]
MRHTYLLLSALLFCTLSCQQLSEKGDSKYWVYVSSWGEEEKEGIGIYQWNAADGSLNSVSKVSDIKRSSYLTVDEDSKMLYTVNQDGLHSFEIDQANGSLKKLNSVPLTGRGGCYISLSNDQRFLLVAYYSTGSVSSYKLNNDRSIGKEVSRKQHQGSSVNQERQESAHAHMILPAPKGPLIFVPDLGMDQVMAYKIVDDGVFSKAPIASATLTPGYGPRHMAFHPNNQFAFVLAELTGHVVSFGMDLERGLTHLIDTVSILPEEFTDFNKSADIRITPNGQYLYASNRGHNSLAVCEVDATSGQLKFLGTKSCGGDWPRAFAIDPTGRYILVANKRSNTISVFEIDYDTGFFTEISTIPTVAAPQCIRFVKQL